MNLNDFNKRLWLWLRERGGHWPSHEVAQRTGSDPTRAFRALHDMAQRGLVDIAPPAFGALRNRYGVTDDCLVPLGLTVGEAAAGIRNKAPAKRPAAAARRERAAAPRVPDAGGLSPAERSYLRNASSLNSGAA